MRRKKLLPVACAALMACRMIGGIPPLPEAFDTALPVSAEQETGNKCGDNATYSLDSNGVLTITGTGSITDSFFCDLDYEIRDNIKALVIGEGITGIGAKAFQSCSNLTVVNLPASLTSIGSDAFYYCSKVEDVYCYADPDNLTWNDFWADDFKYDNETRIHVLSEHLEKYKAAYSDPDTGYGNENTNVRGTFLGDLPSEKKVVDGFVEGTPPTCVQTGSIDRWLVGNTAYADPALTTVWTEDMKLPIDTVNGHNWADASYIVTEAAEPPNETSPGKPGKRMYKCANEGCEATREEEFYYSDEPKFTVTIPASVTLGDTVGMELIIGNYNGLAVSVYLEKANGADVTDGQTEFPLYSDDDHQAEVDYSVIVQKYKCAENGTEYTQSEGTDHLSKDKPLLYAKRVSTSGDAKDSADLYFTPPLDSVPYSGDYTGTLTFRITVSGDYGEYY